MTSNRAPIQRLLRPDDFIHDGGGETHRAPSPRSLSIVVPVLNEAATIRELTRRLTACLDRLGNPFEVIVVDDGSTDATLEALRDVHRTDPRYKTISLSRNFGKEVAVAAGLRHATGDGVVIIDGDLKHPPEQIGNFVTWWDRGYDIVYGQRLDRHDCSRLERLTAPLFYRLFKYLSRTELPPGASDFRLLDRRVVDAFNRLDERSRFNKGLFAWVGFKTKGIPFEAAGRAHGRTRWRFSRPLQFAMDGFATFSSVPLRVSAYLGAIVSLTALLYAIVFLIKTLIWGVDVPGFPSLLISVLLLGGVQLISLGVIGEYLGRVYEEVKQRPLFIVTERVGLEPPFPPVASEPTGATPSSGTAVPRPDANL